MFELRVVRPPESGADLERHELWGLIPRSFYIWMGGGSNVCTEWPAPGARPGVVPRSAKSMQVTEAAQAREGEAIRTVGTFQTTGV